METHISQFSPLQFLAITSKLKSTKRTGWVNHNVQLPESISDHMYRMAILCFLIQDTTINKERAMKVALAHDMAESIAGDITPYDGISKEEKFKLELNGMHTIRQALAHIPAGEELLNLWLEYEKQTTAEARLLKDFDKFEMIVTAFEYEQAQGIDLEDFFRTTAGKFVHPEVRQWDQQLRAAREKFKREKVHHHDKERKNTEKREKRSQVLITEAIEGESEAANITVFTLLCKHLKGFQSVSFVKGEELCLVRLSFDSEEHSAAAMSALQNHKLTPFHFVKLKYQ